MRSVFFLALISLPLLAEIPSAVGPIRAEGRYFRDAKGAAILLRGVNVSGAFKTPPAMDKFQAAHFDPLPAWGVNTVRLLFNWESFEPEKGRYDGKYLEWYAGLVREAGRRGIGVVIDLHQDAFSRFAMGGCGDGFPRWAVVGTPSIPDNGAACTDWGGRQLFDPQVRASYEAFYANSQGVRTQYLALWRRLAARFRSESAVIGYDLLNEPTRGDWASQLLPLYTDAAQMVRSMDNTKIIFVEPVAGRISLGPGLVVAPGMRKPDFENLALAPHFYDLQMLSLGRHLFGRWSDFSETEIDDIENIAQRWNVPVWIGEFGHPRAGENIEAARQYLEGIYGQWNRRFYSALEWSYIPSWTPERRDGWNGEDASVVDGQGRLRHYRPRPHAVRVSGTPTRMLDELTEPARTTASFTLDWDNRPETGETRLFAPKTIFAGPVAVDVSPAEMVCRFENEIHVVCRSARRGPHHLTIRPAEGH